MNDRIQRIISQYDRALAGAEDETIARVNKALDSAYRQLEQQLLKSYQKYQGEGSLLPSQRKLLILQEVGTYLELLNPQQQQAIERDFENLLRGSYGDGLKLSEELVSAIGNEQLQSFASVNLAAVRFQAQDASKRLYRWSQDYQSKISGIVEMHLATGAGPRKVASALRNELGIVKGRAEAIARTESLSSLNAAAQANYQQNNISYTQLISTVDDKVCPYCSARNGNAYKLGEISAPLHVNCLPGDTSVVTTGVKSGTFREYRGEIVCIKTASGKDLTATPNHPVLTNKGWLAIGLLKEGDSVFSCIDSKRIAIANPNDYHRPTLIEKVVRSLHESTSVLSMSMKISPKDFHGDGKGSEICVVSSNRLLGNSTKPQFGKPLTELDFERGSMTHRSLPADRLPALSIPIDYSTLGCPMCGANLGNSLLRSHLLPLEDLSLRSRSNSDSTVFQDAPHGSSLKAEFIGDSIFREAVDGIRIDSFIPDLSISLSESLSRFDSLQEFILPYSSLKPSLFKNTPESIGIEPDSTSGILNRFSGEVFADRIIQSVRKDFVGHVYNLETETGWYFANDIVTHNCRCYLMPWKPEWQKLGLTNDESIAQLRSQAIDELKKQGKEPNYGVAPFERANKLAKPPTPIWKP